jgi:hypothetical protein
MVLPEQFFFLFNVIETNVLRESSTSKFSHSLGQTRHFDRAPTTSGLPRLTDIIRVGRHVSNLHNKRHQLEMKEAAN